MTEPMKVIYIAGQYRDERGEYYVEQNIRTAENAALFVWSYGGVALCPHMNTRHFGGANSIPDEVWLRGDNELLKRCDAIWAIHGWEQSVGASAEVKLAKELNILVLLYYDDVTTFLGCDGMRRIDERGEPEPNINVDWDEE